MIGVSANDGKWHAICVTWDNENGTYQFFKDGAMEKQGTDFMKGYTIKAGGSLVLGQDQDNVGGGFKSSECFRGTLTNVNVSCRKKLSLLFLNLAPLEWGTCTNGPISNTVSKEKPRLKCRLLVHRSTIDRY